MMDNQPQGFFGASPTGKGRGVLVLHAWWGLNATTKAFCTQLAEAGFMAFAPDLYQGKLTDRIAEAEILSGALFENLDQTRVDVLAAAKFLYERINQPGEGLAVIGFSLGAFFALELSVTAPEIIKSVVVFYGTRPGDYENSQAAYLGHFAEADEFEPPAEVNNLEAALRKANRPVSFYNYQGTGHWFAEPDRPEAFNPAAAQLAWDRTLTFLKDSL
jgi:carboxymethylenebutenolidase